MADIKLLIVACLLVVVVVHESNASDAVKPSPPPHAEPSTSEANKTSDPKKNGTSSAFSRNQNHSGYNALAFMFIAASTIPLINHFV